MEYYKQITVSHFQYELPDEAIARYPLAKRDHSKLLKWQDGKINDHHFYDLPELLPQGTLLVSNNTKVIHARMLFRKESGAAIEIFCLEPIEPAEYILSFSRNDTTVWKCLVGNLKRWKNETLQKELEVKGEKLTLFATRTSQANDSQYIKFSWDSPEITFSEILESAGNIPIPPYLQREAETLDQTAYQTIFAQIKGSVAAPTAGLHFTEDILKRLQAKRISLEEVTLHVGAGTFQPVKGETIGEHQMHKESFAISRSTVDTLIHHPEKIIAVGTTSVRTLESIYWVGRKIMLDKSIKKEQLATAQWEPYQNPNEDTVSTNDALTALADYLDSNCMDTLETETRIIILPGYKFKIIAGLITNFHQPSSTLLLLISAILGDEWKTVYQHALENGYRFLSYGDSNLYLI